MFCLFICLFIYGFYGSSLLLSLTAVLCFGALASHCSGFSYCRAQALGLWASVVAVDSIVVAPGL